MSDFDPLFPGIPLNSDRTVTLLLSTGHFVTGTLDDYNGDVAVITVPGAGKYRIRREHIVFSRPGKPNRGERGVNP